MKFGDFFKAQATCQPVNPEPVTFYLWSKDVVLPGGEENPRERMMKATCTACFVFVDGHAIEKITRESKKFLNERKDEKKQPVYWDNSDHVFEQMYRELAAAIREYDQKTKQSGEPFFEQLQQIKKHMQPKEAARVHNLWSKWLEREHGVPKDTETFRGGEEGDPPVVGGEPD